jgi:SpoVK/Ycf46/Vps4 family AAA+-type ATPase
MLSYPGITGYSMDLMARHMDDSDLRRFFKEAAANAPALILFEDIDRFFSRRPEEEASSVSLQQFLNCLDGVDTLDGVIVVATANNPEVLDTAILRRPGRFDRVIEFGNPSEKLRAKYLQSFCPELTGEDLDICAVASEGLSFAQLRESYILAAQTAYEANRNVIPDDISSAIALLQVGMNRADRKRTQKSGFEADFGSRVPVSR